MVITGKGQIFDFAYLCPQFRGGGHSNVKGVSGSSTIHVIRVVFSGPDTVRAYIV